MTKKSTAAKKGKPASVQEHQPKPTMDEALGTFINTISGSNEADLYVYGGPLERQFEQRMLFTVQHKKDRRKNAVLFLDTYGGHADAAYKIARAFKRHYASLTVMVFSDCKSAGTLLCLGADHLVMADLAELGPLDVQIPKEGEFSGRRSGLDITDTLGALSTESIRLMRQHFLDLRVGSRTQISTRDALDNATKLVCGLLSPVYSQINPLSLGESARSNSIAFHYGQRLSNGNLHPGALNKLIGGYPSHGFVIDREEAEELFTSVRAPTQNEEFMMMLLYQKHEQLAGRQSPLISCLTDDYASRATTQEQPKNEADPESSRKNASPKQGNDNDPANSRATEQMPSGEQPDRDAVRNAPSDAGDAGTADENPASTGAPAQPVRANGALKGRQAAKKPR